jgi:hypothetical protein
LDDEIKWNSDRLLKIPRAGRGNDLLDLFVICYCRMLSYFDAFAAKIRDEIVVADFYAKTPIIGFREVRGKSAVEKGERVI